MKVPVTIITGYLGAGKTTLLRRIVDECGMRIAIVMNEFGQVSVDGRVVQGKNIKMVELLGGCVCCSLSGEFDAAIGELLETVKPEWIVLETTGVAEPAALAYDVAENIPNVRLDAIVTVVDADAMVRFPQLGHTGAEQITMADLLVLNKTDLVTKEGLEKTRGRLTELNGHAELVETTQCGVPMESVFGIGRMRPVEKHKTHAIAYEYFEYTAGTTDARFDYDEFGVFLSTLPKEIYRGKGFVRTERGRFLVNYVAGRHTLERMDGEGGTELVFIGKGARKCETDVRDALDKMKRI